LVRKLSTSLLNTSKYQPERCTLAEAPVTHSGCRARARSIPQRHLKNWLHRVVVSLVRLQQRTKLSLLPTSNPELSISCLHLEALRPQASWRFHFLSRIKSPG